MAKKLQSKVQFVFVYAQEIHPNQERNALPGSPVDVIPALSPTINRAEREQRAFEFRRSMKGGVRRLLVDEGGIGGGVTKIQRLYHAENLGSCFFVIDRNRRIAAKGDVDCLEKRLLEIFPELASELNEDDADYRPSDSHADW